MENSECGKEWGSTNVEEIFPEHFALARIY
jgi:hypothetical protein